MIIVCGLPGTGKTTLASALAKALEARHLSSDRLRQSVGKSGQYDALSKNDVYGTLLDRTRESVANHADVVIDATFSRLEWRQSFDALHHEFPVMITWIWVEAEDEVIRKRVSQKREYTEADFNVYLKIKQEYEPFIEAPFKLRSDKMNIDDMVREALRFIHLKETQNKG